MKNNSTQNSVSAFSLIYLAYTIHRIACQYNTLIEILNQLAVKKKKKH